MSIQTSHGLKKTVCCSFPRSGQSLLRPVLSDYFGDRFKYCEWYDEPEKRPNVCDETNFVKTHDRDLNWHIREDWQYLVLIRHPLYSVSSWRIMENEEDNYNVGWKLEHWAKWAARWITGPVPNRMIAPYESIVQRPEKCLGEIIHFLNGEDASFANLKKLIHKHNVCPRPDHVSDWLKCL